MKKIFLLLSVLLGSSIFVFQLVNAEVQVALPIQASYCAYTNISSNLWMGNWNNNRTEVITLQNFLFNYYGVIGQVNATGYYGPTTKQYVAKFQREFGLYPVTGGVGPLTRNKMRSLCGVVGGDTDQYGCKASAGYTWCAVKNKCLRTWEESCGKQDDSAGGANCKVYYDGCNTCSRSYVGGPAMCTLMACINTGNNIWNSGAYCKEYFTNNTNMAPVVKSFTGPVQLKVNETGSWKINASISDNSQLTYDIVWGDEFFNLRPVSMDSSVNYRISQQTTFEHSYTKAGTYVVKITVRSQNGQTTTTTQTVNVQNNSTTLNPETNGQCKNWTDSYGGICRRDYVNGPVSYCYSWKVEYFRNPNLPPVCTEFF